MFHWVDIEDVFNHKIYESQLVVSESNTLYLPTKVSQSLFGSIINIEPREDSVVQPLEVNNEFRGVVDMLADDIVINKEVTSDAFVVLTSGKALRVHGLKPIVLEDDDCEMTCYKTEDGIVVHKIRVPHDMEPSISLIQSLLSNYFLDFTDVDLSFHLSVSDLATDLYNVHSGGAIPKI